MAKKRETKESSETPSEPKQKKLNKKRKLDSEGSNFQLRPITTLWSSQYMKALLSCSKPYEHHNWYNIRVLGNPPQNALDLVIKIFQENLINITQIVALDLGWSRGEWMMRLQDDQSLNKLNEKTSLHYSRGYFMGGGGGKTDGVIPEGQPQDSQEKTDDLPNIEFIMSSISNLFVNQSGEINPVEIPFVLMGIPFHDSSSSNIDLNHYLFEAITAQNRELGIKSVKVKQRYKVGNAETNDVLCHISIDPTFIHKWDLEKTMKVVIQGWDNAGVPRPEMWPVTMRYLDECLVCGGFYHLNEDGISTVDCNTLTVRNDLINRREAYHRKLQKTQSNALTNNLTQNDSTSTLPRTSIGFIVAT